MTRLPTDASTSETRREGFTCKAVANKKTVRSVGDLWPRSIKLTNVGCLLQANASFSCESPRATRSFRTTLPNACSRVRADGARFRVGAMPPTIEWDRQMLYRLLV